MGWGFGEIDKAKLVPIMPPGSPVVFTFNPAQVVITRTVETELDTESSPMAPPFGSQDLKWKKTGLPTLTFKAHLEGDSTKPFSDQLLNWLSPAGGFLGLLMGLAGGGQRKLPMLLFQWGPPAAGFAFTCYLTKCSITYNRFTGAGIPMRAECDLTLTQAKNWLAILGTNPTSGGLPGRQKRTVVEGENIVGVSFEAYGRRHDWRSVAEANGVDDPFRVRPGTDLYLPSRQELNTK
jgi:nucleoid-associated protein YgaU